MLIAVFALVFEMADPVDVIMDGHAHDVMDVTPRLAIEDELRKRSMDHLHAVRISIKRKWFMATRWNIDIAVVIAHQKAFAIGGYVRYDLHPYRDELTLGE